MLRGSVRLSRFRPVWERLGTSSDALFSNVMQSANPYQKMQRDLRRKQSQEEEMEAEVLSQSPEMQRDFRIALERQAELDAAAQAAQDFLPFGVERVGDGWGVRKHRSVPLHQHDAPTTAFVQHSPHTSWGAGRAGFAFDIDGVLRTRGSAIAGTTEMLNWLDRQRIPFILMTNGAGVTHAAAAARYTALFHAPIRPEQVMLSTSPMCHVAPQIRGTVLVVGPPSTAAEAAREIGFSDVITTAELRHRLPEYVPLSSHKGVQPHSPDLFPPISAVLVQSILHCDAFADIQLIVDVLASPNGHVTGAVSPTQSVPVLYSADDFFFCGGSGLCPRLGPGSFREMLASVYESVTGETLHVTPYGKPRRIAYAHATAMLNREAARLHPNTGGKVDLAVMVGDNPSTDVLGANAYGKPWQSALVETGLGEAEAAVRSEIADDRETEWMLKHIRKEPHWSFTTASEAVRELTSLGVDECVSLAPRTFPPPCPVSVHDAYHFPRW